MATGVVLKASAVATGTVNPKESGAVMAIVNPTAHLATENVVVMGIVSRKVLLVMATVLQRTDASPKANAGATAIADQRAGREMATDNQNEAPAISDVDRKVASATVDVAPRVRDVGHCLDSSRKSTPITTAGSLLTSLRRRTISSKTSTRMATDTSTRAN
jgi:hypothetical protein